MRQNAYIARCLTEKTAGSDAEKVGTMLECCVRLTGTANQRITMAERWGRRAVSISALITIDETGTSCCGALLRWLLSKRAGEEKKIKSPLAQKKQDMLLFVGALVKYWNVFRF
jgi:hypothetical protein